jgi:hypothetical protein
VSIIGWLVIGFLAGALARLIVPGSTVIVLLVYNAWFRSEVAREGQ